MAADDNQSSRRQRRQYPRRKTTGVHHFVESERVKHLTPSGRELAHDLARVVVRATFEHLHPADQAVLNAHYGITVAPIPDAVVARWFGLTREQHQALLSSALRRAYKHVETLWVKAA